MDNLKITGRLKVTKKDADGATYNTYYNNVMTDGKTLVARWICGQNPGAITHMAVGTSEDVVEVTGQSLGEEVFRKQINSSVNSGPLAIIDCVFGQGEAVGSLKEAALFTQNGTMFARALINENKGIFQELTISWEITVN